MPFLVEPFLFGPAGSGRSFVLVLGLMGGSPELELDVGRLPWVDELELELRLELWLSVLELELELLFEFELELELELPLLELFEPELELEPLFELFEIELELKLELLLELLPLDLEFLLASVEGSFMLGSRRISPHWAGQFPNVPCFEAGLGGRSSSSISSHA